MIKNIRRAHISFKLTVIAVILAIFISGFSHYVLNNKSTSYAQIINIPIPNNFASLKSQINTKEYHLPVIRGIELNLLDPLSFKFYFDTMDKSQLNKNDMSRLIKYFFEFLTTPGKNLWVNLSPYERSRIIPNGLLPLDIGKGFLIEDYLLKQITASLTDPNTPQGKKYWTEIEKIVGKSKAVNMYQKVWIIPDVAEICEYNRSLDNHRSPVISRQVNQNDQQLLCAFVKSARLKVMMAEDYAALQHNPPIVVTRQSLLKEDRKKPNTNDQRETNELEPPRRGLTNHTQRLAADVFRKQILPIIERHVNKSEAFAPLRQMYYSLILATYLKNKLKNHPVYQIYVDQEKIKLLSLPNPLRTKKIVYESYLNSLKKGNYQKVKIVPDTSSQKKVKRLYVSGGINAHIKNIDFHTLSSLPKTKKQLLKNILGSSIEVTGKSNIIQNVKNEIPQPIIFSDKTNPHVFNIFSPFVFFLTNNNNIIEHLMEFITTNIWFLTMAAGIIITIIIIKRASSFLSRSSLELALKQLHQPDYKEAQKALIKTGKPAIPALITMLAHDNERYRKIASETLIQMNSQGIDIIPLLIRNFLSSHNEHLHASTISILDTIDPKETRTARNIITIIDNPKEKLQLRYNAIKMTLDLKEETRTKIIMYFPKLLDENEIKFFRVIEEALLAMANTSAKAMLFLLNAKETKPMTKKVILKVIGIASEKNEMFIPFIISALHDPNPLIGQAAAKTLGEIKKYPFNLFVDALTNKSKTVFPIIHHNLETILTQKARAYYSSLTKLISEKIITPENKKAIEELMESIEIKTKGETQTYLYKSISLLIETKLFTQKNLLPIQILFGYFFRSRNDETAAQSFLELLNTLKTMNTTPITIDIILKAADIAEQNNESMHPAFALLSDKKNLTDISRLNTIESFLEKLYTTPFIRQWISPYTKQLTPDIGMPILKRIIGDLFNCYIQTQTIDTTAIKKLSSESWEYFFTTTLFAMDNLINNSPSEYKIDEIPYGNILEAPNCDAIKTKPVSSLSEEILTDVLQNGRKVFVDVKTEKKYIRFCDLKYPHKIKTLQFYIRRCIEYSQDPGKKTAAEARNKKRAPLSLSEFLTHTSSQFWVHGTGFSAITGGILNVGNLPCEFLLDKFADKNTAIKKNKDMFPFQTDFIEMQWDDDKRKEKNQTVEGTFMKSVSSDYGDILLIYDRGDTAYENKKYPTYSDTGTGHPLLLGGMPATEISAILLKRNVKPEMIESIKLHIALNGFYIPIYSLADEKCLLSFEEYQAIRKDFNLENAPKIEMLYHKIWELTPEKNNHPSYRYSTVDEHGNFKQFNIQLIETGNQEGIQSAWNTILAHQIYQTMEVSTTDSKLIQCSVSQELHKKINYSFGRTIEIVEGENKITSSLKEGFLADFLLDNIGIYSYGTLHTENITTKDNITYRTGNEKCFLFKHSGERKKNAYSEKTEEEIKKLYAQWIKPYKELGLTQKDVAQQVTILQNKISVILDKINKTNLSQKDRAYLSKAVSKRAQWLIIHAEEAYSHDYNVKNERTAFKKEITENINNPKKLFETLEKCINFLQGENEIEKDFYMADELKKHTLQVLEQFDRYFHNQYLPLIGNNHAFFRLFLSLHDIGKTSDHEHQHKKTNQIIQILYENNVLPINKTELDLMYGLINGDPIGLYLRGSLKFHEAVHHIKTMAQQTGIKKEEIPNFYKLLTIFYQCDAITYSTYAGYRSAATDYIFKTTTPTGEGVTFNPLEGRLQFSAKTETKFIPFMDYLINENKTKEEIEVSEYSSLIGKIYKKVIVKDTSENELVLWAWKEKEEKPTILKLKTHWRQPLTEKEKKMIIHSVAKSEYTQEHQKTASDILTLFAQETGTKLGIHTDHHLLGDLLGLASMQKENNKVISLYKGLIPTNTSDTEKIIALFHEINEYLIKNGQIQNLKISEDKTMLTFFIGNEEKKVFISGYTKNSLTNNNETWWDNTIEWLNANPHYLLRIMQREMFREKDEKLTKIIQETKTEISAIKMTTSNGQESFQQHNEKGGIDFNIQLNNNTSTKNIPSVLPSVIHQKINNQEIKNFLGLQFEIQTIIKTGKKTSKR